MKNVIIRNAELSDLETLLQLEQKVVDAERPYNTTIKTEGAVYYDLKFLLDDKSSKLIVAQVADHIIGTGYAQIRESKKSLQHQRHSYLGFMYVEPEYRGLGLNKRIMANLIEWSKANGIYDMYLDVYDDNEAAIRAYEKVGFEKSLVEMKLNLTD